jgi:ABC-type cobalamin/Fe3+-siderophores transport system ATPase subunit
MQQTLKASNLCYYANGKQLLNNISLEFSTGNLHAILGPNGSGKSTLLKILTGIWKLASGSVTWNNLPLLTQKRQMISRIISLVPQNPQPSFDFLVEDLVAMGRYPYNTCYWKAKEEPVVKQALHTVDIWHLKNRNINQLSFGERQRAYIARALVTESPILLLDEPTASLDIRHQLEIWDLLQRFVKQGKIVVITTHDFSITKRYCSNIAILNQGCCVDRGDFSSVITPKLLEDVFGIPETRLPELGFNGIKWT